MPSTQAEKGARFRALHRELFVLPNPWDAGSAKLLQGLGYPGLATSSAAAAGRRGRRDYALRRDEALADAREIVDATDLPVSADLENGFGDSPEAVQETVRHAAAVGLAGCSIEDAPGDAAPYPLSLAVERITAAVEVVRGLPFPFVLTARAENFTRDRPDLSDTLRRLQAYAAAGAEVLFAPGIGELDAVRTLCASLPGPVNVVGSGRGWTRSQLREAGVKRVSLAASLYRAAMSALCDAAVEVRDAGTFGYSLRGLDGSRLAGLMADPPRRD